MVVHGKSPLKGGSRLQANLPPGTGQQPRFGPSPGQLARLVDYAPAQTFYGRAQGTMDNVHVSHFELRAPGASCAPHPALTLDPSRFSPAPRSPRTNLPHVRYNPCSGGTAISTVPATYEDAVPGSTPRTITSITGVIEESAGRERFRRAHFYPVSEAVLQGHSHPPRFGEYRSGRELRADKVKHSRPRVDPHDKFSYTARPPAANMEYGWHMVTPPSPRSALSSPRVHVPAPPTTGGSRLGDSREQTSAKFLSTGFPDREAPPGFSQLRFYKPRLVCPMTKFADTVAAGPWRS